MRVHLYKNFMLHAKYVVIDDNWATVGSTNLDYLSLRHNREANVVIRDQGVIAELKSHFEADIKDCQDADDDCWLGLPFWCRILGYAGRYVKKVL
jgi:cardiolipin synthase